MNKEFDICRCHLIFLPSILQAPNKIVITDLCRKDTVSMKKESNFRFNFHLLWL